MKILILNTEDAGGGAARAAYRLNQSLINNGINCNMLVLNKHTDDYRVIEPKRRFGILKDVYVLFAKILDRIPIIFYKNRSKTLFTASWWVSKATIKRINEINPDIVHLHWISRGLIKIEHLSQIKAPIVWNCQDMWAFTGGCHYDEGCGGYKKNCGSCKVLGSNRKNDLSRSVWNRKKKTFAKIKNLTMVGVSNWIADCIRNSSLLKDRKTVVLPNCFDLDIFKPIDKNTAREFFKIPKNKKVVLFGAMNSLGDPRKGAMQLFEAINKLEIEDVVFVIAGRTKPKEPVGLKYPSYYIPPLADEVSLALMYNSADVMIVPSLQENLSNSIIESLACAVPVVGFGIGGNSDMIEHKKNGYLAKELDTGDLKNGIEWVLNNKNYEDICSNARDKAVATFDSNVVAKQYIVLYKEVIRKNNKN